MHLNENQLIELCEVAKNAAQKAGLLISTYINKKIKVKNKKSGSTLASTVVTEVDFKSQELILKELETTIVKYDLALLSEETEDDGGRFKKDYFWCIDPLDGTLPFTQKRVGYAVSIALVNKKGTPVIGVVYDPISKTGYHAIIGQGAFKNNKKWVLHDSTRVFSYIPTTTFETQLRQKKILKQIKSLALNVDKISSLKMGGAVMSAIWAMENAPSCYIKFPKPKNGGGSLWDYAATTCIANELGFFVTDVYGESLNLNSSETVFMNKKGAIYATNEIISKIIIDCFKVNRKQKN